MNSIAFFAMVFSLLAIILATMGQISRICEICRPTESKFHVQTLVTGSLDIRSKFLRNNHLFAYNKLDQCFLQLLSLSETYDEKSIKSSIRCINIMAGILY